MEQMEENRLILAIKSQLSSIIHKLSEIEHRLSALERSAGVGKPKSSPARLNPPPPREGTVRYNYLRRTINVARREYEREHR